MIVYRTTALHSLFPLIHRTIGRNKSLVSTLYISFLTSNMGFGMTLTLKERLASFYLCQGQWGNQTRLRLVAWSRTWRLRWAQCPRRGRAHAARTSPGAGSPGPTCSHCSSDTGGDEHDGITHTSSVSTTWSNQSENNNNDLHLQIYGLCWPK